MKFEEASLKYRIVGLDLLIYISKVDLISILESFQ